MGNSEAKIVDALNNPDDEQRLRRVFETFDVDQSGELDKDEWKMVGKYLYQMAFKDARDDIKKEIETEIVTMSPSPHVGSILARHAAEHIDVIARECRPQDIELWVEDMWSHADTDRSGGLTFDEFKLFLATASKLANEEHKTLLRKSVEQKMEAAGNQIRVSNEEGRTTVITVNPAGAVSKLTIRQKVHKDSPQRSESPGPNSTPHASIRHSHKVDRDGPLSPSSEPRSGSPVPISSSPAKDTVLPRRMSTDQGDESSRAKKPTTGDGEAH